MYLETEKRRNARQGLGMGGTDRRFRLFVDSTFRNVEWRGQGAPFEPAEGLSGSDVEDLACLEIWGCGGEEAEKAKLSHQQIQRKQRERAGKIDRMAMFCGQEAAEAWKHNPDKFLLKMMGLGGSQADDIREGLEKEDRARALEARHAAAVDTAVE